MLGVLKWLSLLVLLSGAVQAGGSVRSEYEVKAGFIYNFARFVEWPDALQSPLKLCVIGVDPFGRVLDALEKRDVRGRGITLIRQRVYQPDAACDIAYISPSERSDISDLLARMATQPILTISDIEGFVAQGGMIELIEQNKRIHFMINLSAARAAGLRISAKLLELARAVY